MQKQNKLSFVIKAIIKMINSKSVYRLAICIILVTTKIVAQPLGTLPIEQGMAALSCYSGNRTQGASDPNGYVLKIYDIRGPNCNGNTAPFGPNNWLAPSTGVYHHSSWTASNLGEIFGVDLQKGNTTPDIFVASSGLTPKNLASTLVASGGTGGDVFRINGTTGAITKLASLPNTIYDPHPNNTGVFSKYVGLGNISHNRTHNVLYVTNLDNGMLYVLNATTGTTLGTYDHLPGTPDNSSSIFTTNLRQVYGVSYNEVQNRLYYAVPTAVNTCSVTHPNGNGEARYVTANSIYSLGVNTDGTLNATDKVLVATIPTQTQITCVNNPTDQIFNSGRAYYGVISDIEFNSNYTSMLISEKTLAHRFQPSNNPMKPTDLERYAHESRIFKYNLSGTSWNQALTYSAGDYNGKLTNSSGGVSFGYNNYGTCGQTAACDDAMVALSDALRFENVISPYTNIYGILTSDINGNATGYPNNSHFVDLDGLVDGLGAINAKSTMGDIEVFTNNCVTVPVCAINTPTVNATCNNNGTANNPADDTFTFTINATGTGAGATYKVDKTAPTPASTPFASVTYGTTSGASPSFPISGGNLTLTLTDNTTSTCTLTNVNVPAPATCSSTVACSFTATNTTPVCSDNGTPNITTDDTYTFNVTATSVSGTSATGYNANDPLSTMGTYGTAKSFGPYAISSNGTLNITLTDKVTGTCTFPLPAITAPTPCSTPPTGQPDLELTKVSDKTQVVSGDILVYTLTLKNIGTASATGVKVKDLLPAGLTYVSSVPSQGTYTVGTGIWDVGTVAQGATLTLTITVNVN